MEYSFPIFMLKDNLFYMSLNINNLNTLTKINELFQNQANNIIYGNL